MIDIVERLRASNSAGMLCDEAAGEIEWLRQEHERLRAALTRITRTGGDAVAIKFIHDIARRALEGNCVMSVSAFRKPQQTESKS